MSPIRRPLSLTPESEEDRRRRLLRLRGETEPEPPEPLPPEEEPPAEPLPPEEEVPPEITPGEEPSPVIPRGLERIQAGPELPPTREQVAEREQQAVIHEAVDTIAHLFPDMVTALSQVGVEPDYTPEYTLQLLDTLERQVNEDPDAFLEDLYQRGRSSDTEQILEIFGWTPEETQEFYGPKEKADRFADLVQQVWPQRTVEEVNDLRKSDPGGFIDELRKGGSSTPKSQMLRELGLSWEQVQEVWQVQHLVVPLDGHRELLTIDWRPGQFGKAYTRQGQLVGHYNVTTREFTALPEKDRVQEVKDAFQLASRGAWQGTKGFFLSTVPNLAFPDLLPFQRKMYGEDIANKIDGFNQGMRDRFRQIYSQEQAKFEDWLRKHPEMQPSQRYAEGALKHPDLLKDPFYWAYEFANIAPFTLSSLTVGALATVATGNPWAGLVAAMAVQVPMESDQIRQELLANGMPEGQADFVSLFAGVLIGSLEGAGHFPLLQAVSPQIVRLFRRKAGSEVARLTMAQMFKKAARTGALTWTAETTTEVFQEAVANAAIKIADENRSLFENLPEIAVKSAIGMMPFAAFGASMVRVAPSETAGLTDAEKVAKGWQQDPKSKNWYAEALKTIRRGVSEAVVLVSGRAALKVSGIPQVRGAAAGERITKGAIVQLTERGVPYRGRVVNVRPDGTLIVDASEFQLMGGKRIVVEPERATLLNPASPSTLPRTVSVNGKIYQRMADGKTYTEKRGGERLTYQQLEAKGDVLVVEITTARTPPAAAPEAAAPAAVADYAIDDVIRAVQKQVNEATNPLDKSFLRQQLTDLQRAKRAGRSSVPEEYFINKRTQEVELPPGLARTPAAAPEAAAPGAVTPRIDPSELDPRLFHEIVTPAERHRFGIAAGPNKESIKTQFAVANEAFSEMKVSVDDWLLTRGGRTTLQRIGHLAETRPEYQKAIRAMLRERYPSGQFLVYRGGQLPSTDFVNVTSNRYMAKAFQPLEPSGQMKLVVDGVPVEINDVVAVISVTGESELVLRTATLTKRVAIRLQVPPAPAAVPPRTRPRVTRPAAPVTKPVPPAAGQVEAIRARRQRAALNEAIKSQQEASERLSDALELRKLLDTIERRELVPSLEQYPWAMDFLRKELPGFRSFTSHEQFVDALTPIIQSARQELSAARSATAAIEAAQGPAREIPKVTPPSEAVTPPIEPSAAQPPVQPPGGRPPAPPAGRPLVGPVEPGATQRVLSRISLEAPRTAFRDKLGRGLHTFSAKMIDDLVALKQFTTQAQQGGVKLSIEENPYISARLLKGVTSKATVFLEQGTFGKQFWKRVGKRAVPNYTGESLENILKEVKEAGAWQDFATYLVARRAVDLAGRNIETGISEADARGAVQELEGKHPTFSRLAERVYQYQDRLLVYAQESGLISQDLLAKLRKFGNYVPFYRVFQEMESRGFMGKKMANIAPPVKRIKGSEREILNPLESIVKNTYTLINAADRNQIGIMLANLVDQHPELADRFERVKTPIAPVARVTAKELGVDIEGLSEADAEKVVDIFRPSFRVAGDEVTVLINGKKAYFRVDAELRDALLNLDREDIGILGKILGAPAQWLRAGATLSPDFMVRNPARDQLTAFVYSKYGFLPGIDFMRGLGSLLGKGADYQLFKMSGAEHSMLVSMDRDYLQKTFKEIVGGKRFTDYIKHPFTLLQVVSEFGEKATRLGEFKAGIRRGARPLEAGFSARDVTLDFAKAGTTAHAINRIIAFFNANIRGWDKMLTSFKENPVRTSALVFTGITLPSILLYLVNRDEDWWKEVPQWQKDLFWLVKIPGGPILRIPKPFELGILFGSVPERVLEWLDNKDPKLLKEVLGNALEAGSPGWLPTAILPIIENLTNFSFFRGTAIVPASRSRLPAELQYTDWTTDVSKKLGELLGYSPAKIDNLLFGYTGGLGRYATDILDGVLQKTGITPNIPGPSPTLADMPVIKAFVVRNPYGSSGQAVTSFYDRLQEYERGEGFLKEMLSLGEQAKFEDYKAKHPELLFFYDFEKNTGYSASARYLRMVANQLSDIGKKQDAVYKATDITPSEKRKLIDEMDRLKTTVARQALDLFLGEEPVVLQARLSAAEGRLGEMLADVPELSQDAPKLYDMGRLSSEYSNILESVTAEDLKGKKGVPATVRAWFEKEESEAQFLAFPNVPIYKINADPTKGSTFEDYVLQWQRIQRITDPAERAAEMDKYPKAYLGNLTKRQVELLRAFHKADEAAQAQMLKDEPDLLGDPRETWLRQNPQDNARLALWGQARLYTQAAYDEFVRLQEALDIPDNALPAQTLPPKKSVATHFAYLEAGGEHGWNSWEAQLVLSKDDAYREWAEMEPIKTPVAALELLVEDRPLYDAEAHLRETLPSVPDEDSPDYRTGYQYAISVLRDQNPEWVDNQRRVDALKQGTNEAPTSKDIVEGWVERGRLVDEHGPGSAEALVWLADNLETYQWALDKGLLTDEGGLEAGDWNIPALRITIRYREEDAEYDALPVEGDARANYLAANDAYRQDRRRREAYQLDLADAQVEEYVDYYELSARGYRRERWLQERPGFYNDVWLNPDALGNAAIDFAKVPDVKYDVLLEKWDSQMERYYTEIPAETRLLTGDTKSREVARLRTKLFNDNPGFFQDRLRFEAYAGFVPEPAIKGYVDYYSVLYKGKPAGWDMWWEDDRVLMENLAFFQYARATWGWEDRDFDMVPSVAFERTYNTVYVTMRLPDGSADLKARYAYRGSHKDFDLEGVRAGLWKPHENRAPTDWSDLAPIIARIAR